MNVAVACDCGLLGFGYEVQSSAEEVVPHGVAGGALLVKLVTLAPEYVSVYCCCGHALTQHKHDRSKWLLA